MAPKRTSIMKKRLEKARSPSTRRKPAAATVVEIRKVPQFPDHCGEIEYDVNGQPIHDSETGLKMTTRGKIAYEKRLRIWTECHPPFPILPREYYPKRDSERNTFPVLHWGIPFTHEQALSYAKRHKLPTVSDFALPLFVLSDLIRYTGFNFGCESPLSLNHQYLAVLYDNWSMGEIRLSEEREARIVKVLQKELNPNFEPMWWWDRGRNEIKQDSYCQMDLYPNFVYKDKDF
ncbi:hypothetical protein C8Q75DRAFT_865591 [Abortiporus biennis]|nr:hypothetical protein C8Q75DRAFT_865591 [Abortiporus biennis]